MRKGKIKLTQKEAENTPAGGVVVGKRDGQTMIYDDASLGGYFVGKLHRDGGIKMINKSTGQPLEVQGSEVIITAPAVNDPTKKEFEGKMMTNREILSKINSDGGGVSFADGGDIPAKIHTTDCEYKFGGKLVKDTDIAHSLGMNSTLKKGKQQFSSGDTTYDVDGIYNAIKKGKLRLKTKEIETFPMKYPVYDKNYAENHKIDFRKPNGITVRTESGEEVLIDGNHRMNDAYLKGRKTMKTYYIEDPKQIAKFAKKNKFELGGENKVGGHLSKNKSLKQIAEMHNVSLAHINEELAKGLEVEKEHFSDFKERTRVAKDHLVENPNYYTILAKAGLKMGGRVQRQELVEKSKKGDTPARDLNNYNDIMDLEADGAVGGDSGLAFADGGQVSDLKIGDVLEIDSNSKYSGLSLYVPSENNTYFFNNGTQLKLVKLNSGGDEDYKSFSLEQAGEKIIVSIANISLQKMINEKSLKKVSFADGGITPYDANEEGDSVDIVEDEFAKGGVVYDTTKPKIEKVTIKETRFDASSPVYSGSRQNIVGKIANNVSELQQIVSDYIGSSPKEEYDWISFYVNDASRGKYYVDLNKDKKNTVKNVNPETLNSVNFKRVIDAKDYLVKNYDWTDFFEGASNIPARRGKTVEGVNVVYFDVDGKTRLIQDVRNPFQLYNFLKKLYNDGSRYVELQPSGYGIVKQFPKIIPITNSAWQDILFVKPEKEAVEAIMNTLAFALFPKLDFSKFNNRSNIPASTSAYKADKEVQSVLIKYGKGNEYTALNGESLLSMMQDIWNSNGKTVRTIQIQPKGRIAQLSVLKIIDLVEKPFNIEYEINPDKITLNELRDKLSKGEEWYNDLDWTSFFKENTPASSTSVSSPKKENVVQSVRLNFEKQDGTPYNKITANSGRELFKELEYAENNWLTAEDDFFRFQFIAYYTDSNGIGKSMSEQFNFGDKFFLPSNWSYDSFRRLVYYDWFGNKLDFSEFFHKTYIASSEREVSKVTLTYDTGVLLKEICYNGSELFEAYKLIEEMAEGGSLEVNVTLSGKDKSGQFFETQGTPQEVGQGGFEPSQIYSFEEFEKYFKSLYRRFDFNNFFSGITVPNSSGNSAQSTVNSSPIANANKILGQDLYNSKIWIGNDLKLRDKVFEKLVDLGFVIDRQYDGDFDVVVTIDDYNFYVSQVSREDFEKNKLLKEIFPSDLGIDVPASAKGKPIVEKLYTANGDVFSNIEQVRYFLDNRTAFVDKVFFNVNSLNSQDVFRVELNDVNSDYYYNKSAGLEPKYRKLQDIFELNPAFKNYDWEEFFSFFSNTQTPTTSSNPNNIEPYDAYRITLIWKDNSGKEIIDSMDIFNGVSGAFFISRLKEIEEQSQGKDVEVIIRAFANDDEGNQFEKNDYFTIGEIWFKPSTRTNEEIKSVVEEWIDGVNFDKYFADVIPLSGSQSSATQYKPIDLSQTKIWIGDNRDVSKQIQERVFELGWSWKNLALPTSPNYMFQPALYFHSDKDISYGDDKQLFDSNKDFKEITLEDLFAKIEPAQITQTPTVSGVSGSVKEINNLKEAVDVLEGIASQASQKYNTKKYEESLELLKQVKEEYALALSFTPESSFMYERIELMKKITEIQKEITRITELKNGGAYYILSKVIERLNRGENWKELGNGEIMVNEVPQQEIDTVIYTEKFKNWFGDWEQALITKEYDYVSKALTESGKPCVMYHGAKRIKFSYRQVSNGVVYLAENRSYAEWFSANESPYQKQGDYLTQCFVNLKNPIDLTPFGVEEVDLRDIIQYIDALYPLAKIYDVLPPNTAMAIMNNQLIGRNFRAWYIIRQFPELNKHIRDNTTYDGFIYYENNPSDMIRTESGEFVENVTKATAVFNSNQVKLVDAMLFDSSLDDWRFETGGKVN